MAYIPREIVSRCPHYGEIVAATYADTDRGREEIPATYGCCNGGSCRGGPENESKPQASECPLYQPVKDQYLEPKHSGFAILRILECPECIEAGRESMLIFNAEDGHFSCDNSGCDYNGYYPDELLRDFQDAYKRESNAHANTLAFLSALRTLNKSVARNNLNLQRRIQELLAEGAAA